MRGPRSSHVTGPGTVAEKKEKVKQFFLYFDKAPDTAIALSMR